MHATSPNCMPIHQRVCPRAAASAPLHAVVAAIYLPRVATARKREQQRWFRVT